MALIAALAVGFLAGWYYWGWRWGLEPLDGPAAAPCALVSSHWGADEIWHSLWDYSPGDDAVWEDVRFTRDGDRARLDFIQDGHQDDSIGATKESYWLRWDRAGGWTVTSCSSSVLRCARGTLPAADKCP